MKSNIFLKLGLFCFSLVFALTNSELKSNSATTYKLVLIHSNNGLCLNLGGLKQGSAANMFTCYSDESNLQWELVPVPGHSGYIYIKSAATGLCLDGNAGVVPRPAYLNYCNDNNSSVHWRTVRPSASLPSGQFQLRPEVITNVCLDGNNGDLSRNAYINVCDGGKNPSLIWSYEVIGSVSEN